MAPCQLQGNNFSILTVILSGFGTENHTWFFLGIFELDMAFLIQCALVRSEPRCSRSIAALLNKGSFLPSSQYLCQVGLDSRPSPRPHWASHQSRDPPSCFPIGCGLQLTHPLSQALSSSYRVHRSVQPQLVLCSLHYTGEVYGVSRDTYSCAW